MVGFLTLCLFSGLLFSEELSVARAFIPSCALWDSEELVKLKNASGINPRLKIEELSVTLDLDPESIGNRFFCDALFCDTV